MTSTAPFNSTSPYARSSQRYIDNGLPVIPIAPGTKRPGEYASNAWRGMSEWTRYSLRLPTEVELDHWQAWPDAGIGLMTGPLSGVLAVDIDTEDPVIIAKINQILPPSPVRKKGRKGYTAFYRFQGEQNASWRVGDKPVMDLLCEGRQTLMPGTIHPEGMTYLWLTEDTLDSFDLGQLPVLPPNFIDLMNRLIDPLMSESDRKYLKAAAAPVDAPGLIPAGSFAASHFRDINTQALHRLDEWVPRMIPTAKANANGYRCKAFWRSAEALHVGIARTGIKDFGGDYGMTPIDLVMYAQNVPFAAAAEALRLVLNIAAENDDPFTMQFSKPEKMPTNGPPAMPRAVQERHAILAREEHRARTAARLVEEELATAVPEFILQPPGMIGRISGWMAETAPKMQPELFVAAALVVGATAMGRLYRSTIGNWPSLYVVMVAKTGEGKEHPQQCTAKILAAAGLDRLIAGSGYTSPGAVFSALLQSPSHVAIIDEIGKLLKTSRSQGNSNSEAAFDKLVEAFGKVDGYIKPQGYSTMHLNSAQLAMLGDKTVWNPAICLLGATTPDTFYQSLTEDLIKEGFLGRVLVVHSKRARQKTRMVDQTKPPDDVVAWCKAIWEEAASHSDLATVMNPSVPATPIVMPFTRESLALLDAFDDDLLVLKDEVDSPGLEALLVRTREKAMRISMVVAKAMNPPKDNQIRHEAVEWAIKYVRHYDLATIKSVSEERTESLMHALVKKMVRIIATAGVNKTNSEFRAVLTCGAMPRQKLSRDMKLEKRLFNSVVETAIDQGYIT